MSSSRKRRFDELECKNTSQSAKRIKLDPNLLYPLNVAPNKKSINLSWLFDGQCKVVQYRIENNQYEFLVQKIGQLRIPAKWFHHNDIKHLNCYNKYLKLNNLTYDEVLDEAYIVEEIWEHKYNKEKKQMQFEVKWKNWSSKSNTWEPHENLYGNEMYIDYCIRNNIAYAETKKDIKNLLISDRNAEKKKLNVIVVETARLNSRHFNNDDNKQTKCLNVNEKITRKEILKEFNISCDKFTKILSAPKRKLTLNRIKDNEIVLMYVYYIVI